MIFGVNVMTIFTTAAPRTWTKPQLVKLGEIADVAVSGKVTGSSENVNFS